MRAEGPAVSHHGRGGDRRVLVLDPAGASKHDELPATWRPLTEHHEIVWVRLPAGDSDDGDRLLARVAAHDARTDIVTSGPCAEFALDLARRHARAVRSILLVDPAAGEEPDSAHAVRADELWFDKHRSAIASARANGITVEVIAHSSDDDEDRVPPPLPLGHPRVVEAVREALVRARKVRSP